MRKLVYIIIAMFTGSLHSVAQKYNYATDPLFELVFVDEFDSLGLNSNKWAAHWGYGHNLKNSPTVSGQCGPPSYPGGVIDIAYNVGTFGPGPNRQFDTIGPGYMRLIHRRHDTLGNVLDYNSSGVYTGTHLDTFKFTSAMAISKQKIRFGYIETQWRLTNVPVNSPAYPNGLFNSYGPNFWMLGGDDTCAYSELDIFEQYGLNWQVGSNIHLRRYPNKNSTGTHIAPPTGNPVDTTYFNASGDPNVAGTPEAVYGNTFGETTVEYNGGDWHTAGCEWNDQFTEFYFDHSASPTKYEKSAIRVDQLTKMNLSIRLLCTCFSVLYSV